VKVSVVVSSYNQEDYIEECIDSICSQEVSCDLEVLVSDDASNDSTQEKLVGLRNKYPDIVKLYLHDSNSGAAKNYLFVHSKAQGEFVFHMDGDDVMVPGKICMQLQAFESNPKVNVVFHKAEYFSDDGIYNSVTMFPNGGDVLFSASDLASWGSVAVHSSYAYRRSSRTIHHLENEFMEWFFAMDSILPNGVGVFLDKVLVRYRCNPTPGSYLSTHAGAKKAYNIYLDDIEGLFVADSRFREELYANYVVSYLAMSKFFKKFPLKRLKFLILNARYFNYATVKKVFDVRRYVGPEERLR